jgi:hypothetical protein
VLVLLTPLMLTLIGVDTKPDNNDKCADRSEGMVTNKRQKREEDKT